MNKLGGRYKMEAFVPGNPPRVLADWFDNLITDGYMNLLGTTGSSYSSLSCVVGTGNTPPAFTDTQLAALKAVTSSGLNYLNGKELASNYSWFRQTFQFDQGQAAGNLAEVGVSTGGILISRALIKDAQGNPTTITVLPDEILQVTWEFRVYWPQAAVTGTANIAGSGTHDFSITALHTDQPSGWVISSMNIKRMGFFQGGISLYSGTQFLGSTSSGSLTTAPYINNSFKRNASYLVPIDIGNYSAGIDWFVFGFGHSNDGYGCYYKVTLDPPIMKTAEQTLTLNVELSWARA